MTESNSEKNSISQLDAKLAKEAILLADKYNKLKDRYTALFTLNQLSSDCADLDVFFRQVHHAIASLMTAENFYIVMYDQTFSTLEFVYHVDEKDDFPAAPFDFEKFKGSMTRYVIESGKPLLGTPKVIDKLTKEGKVKQIGCAGTDWLGIPLINDGVVIGVMVVQSY